MSAQEITLAVRRGAEALAEHVGGPTQELEADGVPEMTVRQAETHVVLAAALDVEEIARAIHASDFPNDDWDQEVHSGLRDECLKNARAVRATILGGAS